MADSVSENCAIHIESDRKEDEIIRILCKNVIEKMLAGFSGSCQISWRGITFAHQLNTEKLLISSNNITNIETLSTKVRDVLQELLKSKYSQP